MGPKWGQRAGQTDPTRLNAGRVSSLTSANKFQPRATPSEKRKVAVSRPGESGDSRSWEDSIYGTSEQVPR